ncbi:MAG TPA: hypothetical protein VGB74_05085 [Actinoplanes sp.]
MAFDEIRSLVEGDRLLTINARVGAELEHDTMLSLFRWVGGNRDPRDGIRVALNRRPAAELMGPVETIDVVVSNLIALASLATSVAAWRSSRPSKPDVTIVVNDISVRITEPTAAELRQLAEAAEAADPETPGEGSGAPG